MHYLLIAGFGVEIILEVNKDAFVHIAFKPKENLAEFLNQIYVKVQQLVTSWWITIAETFFTCLDVLKINTILWFRFKSLKSNLRNMKNIKNLLIEM